MDLPSACTVNFSPELEAGVSEREPVDPAGEGTGRIGATPK